MKQNESNKQRVLRVHPDATITKVTGHFVVQAPSAGTVGRGNTERETWRHARRMVDRHAEADLNAAINELVEVITA